MVIGESLETSVDEEPPSTNTTADYLRRATREAFEDALDERADSVQSIRTFASENPSDYEPIITFTVRSDISSGKSETQSSSETYEFGSSPKDYAGTIWAEENRYSTYTKMVHDSLLLDLRDWETCKFSV